MAYFQSALNRTACAPGGGYELVTGREGCALRVLRGLTMYRVCGAADNERRFLGDCARGEPAQGVIWIFREAGFKRLIDQYGLTREEAARAKWGKTQSAVANKLRLLRLCSPQK